MINFVSYPGVSLKIPNVMSTQYKTLAPNALWFTYQNLKSCKPHAKSIDEKLKTKGLMFFVSFFHVIYKISNFNM